MTDWVWYSEQSKAVVRGNCIAILEELAMNDGPPGAPSLEWLEKNNVVFIEQGEHEHWTHDVIVRACRAMREEDCIEAEDM